jgi:uncharacterized protein YlxP (DUF503 family)
MSPPPPIDSDSTQSLVKDGLVASILGGLAMTARLLLSTEPVSPGWVLRRITAAAITAALVGYSIQDHIASPGLRMAVVGAAGYAAPEVMDYVLKYIKARGEAEVAKVTKKSNAKKKPTKRGK